MPKMNGAYIVFILLGHLAFITLASQIITVTAYDETVLGPKECAKGPEVWCNDLRTAKKCGAVKHCIQTVWKHTKLPSDKSDICETCKKMVEEAREQLQSNETQQEIREVLEGTCRIYFPIKILAEECIKYVDEFSVELVEMLVSRMDPQMICSTAGLCNSLKVRQLIDDLKYIKPLYKLKDDCEDCTKFVDDAVRKVKQMSKKDVENQMLEVCSKLGGTISVGCRMVVADYFNEIYTYLTTQLNSKDFCSLANMCTNHRDPVEKEKPQVSSIKVVNLADPECEFCVAIVNNLKRMITENSTKEEVRDVLLNLCTAFKSLKDRCTQVVNDYFEEIYNFITNEFDGQLICSAIGICKKNMNNVLTGATDENNVESNSIDQDFSKTKPNVPNFSVARDPIKVYTKFPSKKKYGDISNLCGDGLCVLCQYTLHDIQNILMNHSNQVTIKDAVEKVCNLAPTPLKTQCVKFIDEYGDAIITLLAQGIDPSTACVKLELCSYKFLDPIPAKKQDDVKTESSNPTLEVSAYQLPAERLNPQMVNNGQVSCMICQYTMGLMHSLLSENQTKEAMLLALDDVCHKFPSKQRDICDSFTEKYGPMIIDLLEHVSPSEVCAFLNVCPAHSMQILEVASVPALTTEVDKCDACILVVDYVRDILKNTTVDAEIALALERVCNLVPVKVQEMCKAYIETYGPAIIQMLVELKESKAVCQAVELCAPTPGTVQLLGGKKCTYGPAYWCKSIIHARACKAEAHCKKHVWKAIE